MSFEDVIAGVDATFVVHRHRESDVDPLALCGRPLFWRDGAGWRTSGGQLSRGSAFGQLGEGEVECSICAQAMDALRVKPPLDGGVRRG